jgi:hypothetical protein
MSDKQHGSFWMHPVAYWSAAVLLGVGIFLAITLEWIDNDQVKDLRLDVVKFALQLAVVGVVGGMIKRALDEHKALTEFRVEIITELGKAHCQIYALRRALALRRHEPEVVREYVFQLMNVRNELGSVGHMVRTKRDIGQGMVVANIAVIRSYFEELIDEAMSRASDDKMTIGPAMELFIAGCRGDSNEADAYRRRFKAPYLRAKSAVDPTWVLSEEQLRTKALTTETDRA